MTRRGLVRSAFVAAAVALVATVATVPVVRAQDIPPLPEEGAPVWAVLSPIVAPVCAASGTSTLLVPVLGGVLEDQLGLEGFEVGDTILSSLGPVFVVCGVLPGAPGTRCQLDDQIAGVLPADVTNLGLPPTVIGSVIDAVDAILDLLGATGALPLATALECTIPPAPGAAEPPPSAPPPPLPPASPPPAAVVAPPSLGLGPTPLPAFTPPAVTPRPTTPTAPAVGTTTLPELISQVVPDWLRVVQILVAAALLAFLAASWVMSIRISRAP